jgi:hypothetical protein
MTLTLMTSPELESNPQANNFSPGYDSDRDPLRTDWFSDGYQENPEQINWGDTPYAESLHTVDPQLGTSFQVPAPVRYSSDRHASDLEL